MSTTTASKTVPIAPANASVTWQMWVPCLAMAACSWLSFFHRTMFAALAPTILKDTGLTAQQFASINAYFFVAYTLGNPLWGSILDYVGLRVGMLLGVTLWTAASVSHGWMTTFIGFAAARAWLGVGEGVTFPGGVRTAVESLPATRRARAFAVSFSGGTLGGVAAPLIVVPLALKYGWRTAFVISGAFGLAWLILWIAVARPPFLPKTENRTMKISWPNLRERRLWALVFSYGLPAIAPGPIVTLLAVYLNAGLHVTQKDIGFLLWMPSLAWGIGYFVWGWIADRYAQDNRRPVGLLLILTALALPLGATTWTASIAITMALMSWATFIGGGAQMVALKAASYSFPREQAAMMTGIASGSFALFNYIVLQLPVIGLGTLFNQHRYAEAWWIVALCPVVGTAVWLFLSRDAKRQADSAQP
jgi:ACS family hexuronate transporter-like MFS transporter